MENISIQQNLELEPEIAIETARAKLFKVLGILYRTGKLVKQEVPFIEEPKYKPGVFYPNFQWEFVYPRPDDSPVQSGINDSTPKKHVVIEYNDWNKETGEPEYPKLSISGVTENGLDSQIKKILDEEIISAE